MIKDYDIDKFDNVTIIIPAFNEENGIASTLFELEQNKYLSKCEIIIIDDGSTDGTYSKVKDCMCTMKNLTIVRHNRNKGYGSAIATGCRNAGGEIIAWYDADGQHRAEDLVEVLQKMFQADLDYCIGIRGPESHHEKSRKLGKSILKWIVDRLAREPVADFNSGMRVFKKSVLEKYLSLLPKRFGASTVTTFIMQEQGYRGGEIPIVVRKRIGKSTVRQFRDGMRTIGLIMNIIILFRPKEVFGMVGALTVLIGTLHGIIVAMRVGLGIPVLSAIIVIFGLQIFFFGILSAQISALRLEGMDRFV